jgi:DNA repair photolyase
VENEQHKKAIKGRGSSSKPDARYLSHTRHEIDDGWDTEQEETKPVTTVTIERPKSIISKNKSPDLPFDQSINAYRGCEHGCIYCYARPTHAYQDLSPGLDFETKLFAKPNAAELLKKELAAKNYTCMPMALGTNTDPYQPIEREYKITREVIQVLKEHHHPLTIVTKSHLIERDIDLLAPMAEKNLVQIFISVTTLDHELMQNMEPRATAPKRRLQIIKNLTEAGIPTGLICAPIIPVINDSELETILERSAEAGANKAAYMIIRLPHEIKNLFEEWLEIHYPLKKSHVMSMITDLRAGKKNDTQFHTRMSGTGVYADLIKKRFIKACKAYNLNMGEYVSLNTSIFKKPVLSGQQQSLF